MESVRLVGADSSSRPGLPLALRERGALAKSVISGASGAVLARRFIGALARREPAPVLAAGFGAGLLAGAWIRSLAARHLFQLSSGRRRMTPQRVAASRTIDTDLVSVEVQTAAVHVTRFFRR